MINGKTIARQLKSELKKKVSKLRNQPYLATIQIGNDPASRLYIEMKDEACKEVGIKTHDFHMQDNCSAKALHLLIDMLNHDSVYTGILVEKPFRVQGATEKQVGDWIDPLKDIDGVDSADMGKFAKNGMSDQYLTPCTPQAVMTLLDVNGIDLKGKSVAVVGRSDIVGIPLALMLIHRGAEVSVYNHSLDKGQFRRADHDVIISATGHLNAIHAEEVSPRSILVPVSEVRDARGHLHGDFSDLACAKSRFAFSCTGNVGPLTVFSACRNLYLAYRLQTERAEKL